MKTYTPKLVTVLREGYSFSTFRADAIAGVTVAIVALPLAMALGIASGASPDKGLITAVIAGFLISALGGSRMQVGGPTGAFVVVIFNVIAGNADAHGKNFSILYDAEGPRLAPLYDLLATVAYPDLSPKFAMKIGKRGTLAAPSSR
jgi:MFS superfamily sulfate permease-like transporter